MKSAKHSAALGFEVLELPMNITPIAAPQNPHNEDMITQLDPALIRLFEHPNRDESFFKSPAYFALRFAILITRGNTVPVRVHPTTEDSSFLYAADYGICRIRCCLELGLEVTASCLNSSKIACVCSGGMPSPVWLLSVVTTNLFLPLALMP